MKFIYALLFVLFSSVAYAESDASYVIDQTYDEVLFKLMQPGANDKIIERNGVEILSKNRKAFSITFSTNGGVSYSVVEEFSITRRDVKATFERVTTFKEKELVTSSELIDGLVDVFHGYYLVTKISPKENKTLVEHSLSLAGRGGLYRSIARGIILTGVESGIREVLGEPKPEPAPDTKVEE